MTSIAPCQVAVVGLGLEIPKYSSFNSISRSTSDVNEYRLSQENHSIVAKMASTTTMSALNFLYTNQFANAS